MGRREPSSKMTFSTLKLLQTRAGDIEELVSFKASSVRCTGGGKSGGLGRLSLRSRSYALEPSASRWIETGAGRAGFLVVKSMVNYSLLQQRHVRVECQRPGIKDLMLEHVFARADNERAGVRVGTLVGADLHCVFLRHGSVELGRDDFTVHGKRLAGSRLLLAISRL